MASIKIRAKQKDGVCDFRALIKHPMETGLRKDKKTGQVIPAHFIQEISVTHNGNEVLGGEWGTAVSANPYLAFNFSGAASGDKVALSWQDNQGNTDSAEVTLK